MLSNMERNADGLTVLVSQRNLNIRFPVLWSIIPKYDSKHLRLNIELIQKRFNFLNRNHCIYLFMP